MFATSLTFNLVHVAGIVAVIQSVVVSSSLFRIYKNKSTSSKYMASLLLVYAALLVSSIIGSTSVLWDYILVSAAGNQALLLAGPLMYFHARAIYSSDFSLTKKSLIHFVPFLFAVIITILIVRYDGIAFYYTKPLFYLDLFHCLYMSLYFFVTIDFLKRNGKVKEVFFQPLFSQPMLPGLVYIGYLAVWLLKIAVFIGWDILRSTDACRDMTSLLYLMTFLFVNTIAYLGMNRSRLFHHTEKYVSSALNEEEKERILQRILSYMERERPYLNASASLATFSAALKIPTTYISQVMSESMKKNFRDLLNGYRIEEAKRKILMGSGTNGTILNIAYEVGFNSKSTFNSAFKKITGLTPKEFRDQHQSAS